MNTHFTMPAPKDYSEGAGTDQVLGIVLVVAEDLHLSRTISIDVLRSMIYQQYKDALPVIENWYASSPSSA